MSKKVHVFNAGPCLLPQVAIDNTIEALKDFAGTGISVISVSHRSKEWDAVILRESEELVLELLLEKKAAYLDTGVWAHKALKEAQGIGDAYAIACSKDKNYTYIPKGFEIPADLDYLHITTNNTIYGTEIHEDLDVPCPLIADMSSDIMSRPVDVSKYDLIYGGAQKNVGPAGVIFAIIRKDSLGRVSRYIPTMLDYRTHIDKGSMFNTPPVFAIFVMKETLKWLKSIGGVEAMYEINKAKAKLLYDEIDRNSMFIGTAAKEDRSLMSVEGGPLPDERLLRDGPRQGGVPGRVPRFREGSRHGGHQGPPLRRRLPRLPVQRLLHRRCPGPGRLHEGI